MAKQTKGTKIETITHDSEIRKNIPTAELENLMRDEEAKPQKVEYPRKNNPNEAPELYTRNGDLDPQLVWKGKDEEDKEPLSIDAVPIYVQEQIQPKAIIGEIQRQSKKAKIDDGEETPDLFADWAQELDPEDKIEFYQHAQKWTNRMILGDSLQVMASLSEKEGLKEQVQCIYFDPPYGINFGSNWQPTTTNNKVANSKAGEAREPEVIRAFRDTWEKGINSYLSYIRDRLTLARELLTESGSLFLQIGDENVHLLRVLMDEVFGKENFVSQISFKKTSALGTRGLASVSDYLLWYAKDKEAIKYFPLFEEKRFGEGTNYSQILTSDYISRAMTKEEKLKPSLLPKDARPFESGDLTKPGPGSKYDVQVNGKIYRPGNRWWGVTPDGMERARKAQRLIANQNVLRYKRFFDDFAVQNLDNSWTDNGGASNPVYVVQTNTDIVKRCLLMTTEPGDLVFDPTCGSGTTAYVAEQWGRRWITTDTSRVSLALARSRLMASHFDYYLLADSHEGFQKECEISAKTPVERPHTNNVRLGFVYQRCPRVTLANIARNAEIDTIWERYENELNDHLLALNQQLENKLEDWEVPLIPNDNWSNQAKSVHVDWLTIWKKRQREIDDSIAKNSETEHLFDRPYKKKNVVRVTGPFTVESLSPHRIVPTDAEDEALLEQLASEPAGKGQQPPQHRSKRLRPKSIEEGETKFFDIVQENLAKAGVQNTKKGERLEFLALNPWPNGRHIQFEGRYTENGRERKAAICVGPEYGTVTRSLMVQAAREASDYFDILVMLGFAFEAHADEDLLNIGRLTVLRARMNNDLHMADRLKSGKSGNLFVFFGEPDIELRKTEDDKLEVEIKGVDIFDPTTGDIKASGPDDIACWFIDTDYNDEAFFVRHAYFSGGGPDPFKRLKTTLKAEINEDAWASLYSTVSRPFEMPSTGRIAVKAINHYGDEVLKVFDV